MSGGCGLCGHHEGNSDGPGEAGEAGEAGVQLVGDDAAHAEHHISLVESVREHAHQAAHAVEELVEGAVERAQDVVEDVHDIVTGGVSAFSHLSTRFRGVLEGWLKDRIRVHLVALVDKLPSIIKRSLNRAPDKPQWLWYKQCHFIDECWPDVRKELMHDVHLLLAMDPPTLETKEDDEPGVEAFRRFFRYALFPYDRSVWGRAKSPVWITFFLMSLVPFACVPAFAFSFVFLIIDKKDEYQLIKFILMNKGTQVVCNALMLTFVGYFMFVSCVTAVADPDDMTCARFGPGAIGPIWLILGGWVWQVALSWLAAALLPWTLVHEEHAEERDNADEGLKRRPREAGSWFAHFRDPDRRHIRRIVMYDFLCTTLCFAGFVLTLVVEHEDVESYVVRETIFACQVAYGYLSLPFFVFCLPVLSNVLLHCRRTAYDKKGRCRFFLGPPKPPPEKAKVTWKGVRIAESDGLMGRVMGIFGGHDAHAADKPIFHDFEPATLMRPTWCSHCHGFLKGVKSQGRRCGACGAVVCPACGAFEEPCPAKAENPHQAEETPKPGSQAHIEEADHEESAGERFNMFSSYWQITGKVCRAMHSPEKAGETRRFKEVIRVWVKKHSHEHIEALIDRIPVLVKWLWESPDMPSLAKKGTDRFVDGLWGEIREEIMYSCKVALDGRELVEEEEDASRGVDRCRAYIRHSMQPYNQTLWWQLRNPCFLTLAILPLIPWGAIVPAIFLFIFLVIDKSDEFQLILFILRFKGMQFLSHGIIKSVTGYFAYFSCTTKEGDGHQHTCEISGPGIQSGWRGLFEVTLGGWVLQILLTWLAFALLRFSKDKGRRCLQSDVLGKSASDIAAGGHIRSLFIWDIFCALLFLAMMAYVMSTQNWEYDHWVVQNSFFACQVVYGYLAIPFIIFNLPLLQTVLTHSVRTGYDQKGRIRAIEPPEKKSEEVFEAQWKLLEDRENKRDGRYQAAEDEEHHDDHHSLLERFRELIHNMMVYLHWTKD